MEQINNYKIFTDNVEQGALNQIKEMSQIFSQYIILRHNKIFKFIYSFLFDFGYSQSFIIFLMALCIGILFF
jgi:hypothetical protein